MAQASSTTTNTPPGAAASGRVAAVTSPAWSHAVAHVMSTPRALEW